MASRNDPTLPEIIHHVKTGDRVFIDDGKIGAIVTNSPSNEDYVELEITYPVDSTSKIRPEKGLKHKLNSTYLL